MKSALKKLIGRRRSCSNEPSRVRVSARPQIASAEVTLYRPSQNASTNFTDRGSSAVTGSTYHAASYRRCGICYFELPVGAQPMETTDANGVDRYGEIVPPPSDLTTRIVDLDMNELSSRVFCIDTMHHSAKRGCEGCSKMREVLIRFNHYSKTIPTSDVLFWSTGGSRRSDCLVWNQKYPGPGEMVLRDFELFSSNPNVEDHPFVTKGLQPSGDTSLGFWRLADWSAACNSSHMTCRTIAESPLPSRLLFVERGPSDPIVFLMETAGMRGQYFCLSHCWGKAQLLRLTKQSRVAYMDFGIPWESMPQAFKDAAMVTLELGFNFLWIDSLCIIQDDEEDWKQEAASMGSIYQNSYVTLAATKSHGSDESLFSEIDNVYKAKEVAKVGNTPILFRKRLEHPNSLNQYYHSLFEEDFPLLTRGWVYQERLLSPRMIHFTKNELVWECLEESWCECSQPFVTRRDDEQFEKTKYSHLFNADEDDILNICKEWHHIVEKYTTHQLTFTKDKLPAISAVAKQLGVNFDFTLGKYLGGLWEDTLDYDFTWVNKRSWDRERPMEVRPRPQPRSAPTWSWASIEDEVHWPADDEDNPCGFINFTGSKVTPSGPDEYGGLRSGKLFLSGILKSGILRYSAYDPPAVEVDGNGYNLHLDYALHAQGEGQGESYVVSGTEVFCLQCGFESVIFDVGQWQSYTLANCLVLRCMDKERGIYERIGIVRPPRETAYEDWFGEILESDITLV